MIFHVVFKLKDFEVQVISSMRKKKINILQMLSVSYVLNLVLVSFEDKNNCSRP